MKNKISKSQIKKQIEHQRKRAIKSKNAKAFYKNHIKSQLDDIVNRLDGFETVNDVIQEMVIRIFVLRNSKSVDSQTLGEKIEHCFTEECNSAACPLCSRSYRMWFFAEASKISRMYKKLYAVTIVKYDRMLSDYELFEIKPKVFFDSFRKQLERIGFQFPVIGTLEFDYHREQKMWLPHYHLLCLGPREAIEPLRQYYKGKRRHSSAQIDRPLQIKKVKESDDIHGKYVRNKAKAISYACKSFSQEVRAWKNPETNRRGTKKFRLDDNRLRLSLRVYDRVGFNGLLFLYNVRRIGGKLVVNEK